MIRTFIAAEVSEPIRNGLARTIAECSVQAPLVKWAKPDNLHLTFRFLGDIKENDLAELFDALEDAVSPLPAFPLEVRGIGAFPNWRHPRVVWAGCGDGSEEAIDLAGRVEEAVTDLGYEPERRPFRPHFTLGRVKQPADAHGLAETVAGLEDKVYGYIDVDAVVVFMSQLRRTGPVYAPMARVPLDG